MRPPGSGKPVRPPRLLWRLQSGLSQHLPGLVVVGVLAAIARGATLILPRIISEVTVGVLLGLAVANLVQLPAAVRPGFKFAGGTLLRIGIVLLGAQLSFYDVLGIGMGALLAILLGLTAALLFAIGVGELFGLPPRLCTLIGVGTAVCGNSAIVATAPVIEARSRDVSFAVATITLFGTLAVLLYPVVGRLAGFSDVYFGYWAGMAVNDTSQVVATGFAYSETAGRVATIVKLTRNTLIGPLIAIIGVVYLRAAAARSAGMLSVGARLRVLQIVPLFVIGFLVMALLNTFGLVPRPAGVVFNDVARALILAALVAVGLSTRLEQMLEVGMKPLYLGLLTAILLSGLALLLTAIMIRA